MTTQEAEGEISVGGACTMAVRSILHLACQNDWKVGSIDVMGAFLQAPRRKSSCVTVTEPPSLLRAMGLTEMGEKWKANCALYGFVESPADWSAFRDASLRKASWVWKGEILGVRLITKKGAEGRMNIWPWKTDLAVKTSLSSVLLWD